MVYDLIQHTDEYLTTPRIRGGGVLHYYPSEASVKWTTDSGEEIIKGTCMRRAYFRCVGIQGQPYSAKSEFIFKLGSAVEDMLTETWKRMGIWVANSVRWYNEEYNLSGEVDVILRQPDGVIYGVECCTADSLVVNSDYKLLPLLDVTGVISHTGEEASIKNFQIKEVNNIPVYKFKSKVDGLHAEFTSEHPILTAKIQTRRLKIDNKTRSYHFHGTKWKKASEIKRGDYICIPKAKFGFAKDKCFYSQEALARYDILTDKNDWRYKIVDNKIYSYSNNALQQEKGFPARIPDMSEFYWMLGLYIAEGSCSKNTVYFSLHENEKDIIARLYNLAKSLGLEANTKKLKDTKCVNVSITSKAFRELIKSLVPGNTIKKTKCVRYERLDKRYLNQLLYGIWQGDGCKASEYQYRITTSVSHLAYFYFQLAAHTGQHPRIKKYKQQSNFDSDYIYSVEWADNKNTTHSIEKLIDAGNFWCYKVKEVNSRLYSGKVYNLECTPEHTYTVGCIATHNCKSFYGYFAESEYLGSRGKPGFPKYSHLLQTLVYQYQFPQLDHFKIVYLGRDKAKRTSFNVKLVTDTEQDEHGNEFIVQRPCVQDTVILDWTMQDILARYKELDMAVKNKIPPPREFDLKYSEEKIEAMRAAGNMSTLKYNKWKKCKSKTNKEWPGDWCCSYCPFENICWDKAGNPKGSLTEDPIII